MGAVAGPKGIVQILLPHYQMDDLKAMLAFENPAATENAAAFADLVERSRAYFNAQADVDFSDVQLELPKQGTFTGMVLRACREIPYGQTVSYSELAKAIKRPDAARAVAASMGKNPFPLVVPCHRVTYAGGKLGGFSAPGGEAQKKRMLEMEAAQVGSRAS